jgi:aminocarboxymuconate-semialdehyde decarboxylase
MLIDLHGHQLTRGMFNRDDDIGPAWENGTIRVGKWILGSKVQHGGTLDDILDQMMGHEPRLKAMDELGVDMLVVSLPSHLTNYWTAPDFNVAYAAAVNEELANYCSEKPERFKFWAHLPMQDPQASVKELDRAVTQLGAVGAGLGGANFGGLEFYSPEFFPLWEKLCELDVPVFVHGYNQSVTWGDRANDDPFDTTSIIGMCYDEARCFWYLVCGGVLDHFPQMKVYITHGGGYVPYQLGRFNETLKTMAPDSKNKKDADEYLGNFYFDPLVHSTAMRRAIADVIGVDQLLYGDNFGGADSIRFDLTQDLGLSDTDREKIRSGNAKQLLRL